MGDELPAVDLGSGRFVPTGTRRRGGAARTVVLERTAPASEYGPSTGGSGFDEAALGQQDFERRCLEVLEFADREGNPTMIAESDPRAMFQPSTGAYGWERWDRPLFDPVERHDVKALCYINQDWNLFPVDTEGSSVWVDLRVQQSELLRPRWIEQTGKSRDLRLGPELDVAIGR